MCSAPTAGSIRTGRRLMGGPLQLAVRARRQSRPTARRVAPVQRLPGAAVVDAGEAARALLRSHNAGGLTIVNSSARGTGSPRALFCILDRLLMRSITVFV